MTNSEGLQRVGVPDGSALPWILDHFLRYPGSYEIPLRTMYSLNCKPSKQAQSFRRSTKRLPNSAFSSSPSPSRPDSPFCDSPSDAAAEFKAQLIRQISRLPSQPCSLPPSFITSFLRRCFTSKLEEVDFPQALTGLDYLKDLESRRRKEVVAALRRLGITETSDLRKFPGVLSWIESIQSQEKRVEALYTQVYIGLRRWTLINEMLLEPYNKATCIAMLNTLFPPVTQATKQPTPQLTPRILRSQRDGFFRYISSIDTTGKQILDQVRMQGARQGEENGWPLIHEALNKYLQLANEIIEQCLVVGGPESFDRATDELQKNNNDNDRNSSGSSKGRKADSGISFGSSSEIPNSLHTGASSGSDTAEKASPPSPSDLRPPTATSTSNSNTNATYKDKVGGSALERLAREFRKLGDSNKIKSLAKMRSSSALGVRTDSPSVTNLNEESSDVEERKRKR